MSPATYTVEPATMAAMSLADPAAVVVLVAVGIFLAGWAATWLSGPL